MKRLTDKKDREHPFGDAPTFVSGRKEQIDMYTKIPTAGMSREAWVKLRKTGIGGSDLWIKSLQ